MVRLNFESWDLLFANKSELKALVYATLALV